MTFVSLISKDGYGPYSVPSVPLPREEAAPRIAQQKAIDLVELQFLLSKMPRVSPEVTLNSFPGISADLLYNDQSEGELKKLQSIFTRVIEQNRDTPEAPAAKVSQYFLTKIDQKLKDLHSAKPKRQLIDCKGSLDTIRQDLRTTFGNRTFDIEQAAFEIGNCCLKALDTWQARHYYVKNNTLYFNRGVWRNEQPHAAIEKVKFAVNANGKFIVKPSSTELSVLKAAEGQEFDSLEEMARETIKRLSERDKCYNAPGVTFTPIQAPSTEICRNYFMYRRGSTDLVQKDFIEQYSSECK